MFERAEEESYKDLINQVEVKEITILLRNISRKIDLIDDCFIQIHLRLFGSCNSRGNNIHLIYSSIVLTRNKKER